MRLSLILPLVVTLSLVTVSPTRAAGQTTRPTQPPGAGLRVFLVTFSPGDIIYERFGHNLICIHDPNPSPAQVAQRQKFEAKYGTLPLAPPFNTTDIAYHYGAFSFEDESFIWRFIHGRMEYWMDSHYADLIVLSYVNQHRGVSLLELNLTPAQTLELQSFLDWNALEENRKYRYDYYRDNCSTRVRDALDRVTDGELKRQFQAKSTGTTYRSHTRRLTSGLDLVDLFWFTSFTYIMGHAIDEPLSAWEESFIPGKLADHVRNVSLPDSAGGTRPLVLREFRMSEPARPPMPETEPHRIAGYLIAGVLFGGVVVTLARLAMRSRWARAAFLLAVIPWTILWGLGGAMGLYAWTLTDHLAAYRNENLLQMSPLLLIFAFILPAAIFRKRRGLRVATILAIASAALSILGLLLKALPAFWQHNGEIIALAVPANIGLAGAMWLLLRQSRSGGESNAVPRLACPAVSTPKKDARLDKPTVAQRE